MRMRRNLRLVLATATAAALTGGLLTLSAGAAATAAPAKHADDFNGDGHRDFAVGGNGSVTVTYGTAKGPGTTTRTFTQNSPGIPGPAGDTGGYRDQFGNALATGDFNRDGYADLAVGDRTEAVGNAYERGAVTLIWGSRSGLGSAAARIPTLGGYTPERFGNALATGDFDGDGRLDLAASDTHAVYIYRGGFGTSGTTGRITRHSPASSAHYIEPGGLVAGQVTKDKATDLYVLGQGYDETLRSDTAAAWFLRGGSTVKPGALTVYNTSFTPFFGVQGVIADFDKDGYGDLAVGDRTYRKSAGAVSVVRGGGNGPTTTRRLTQSTDGIVTGATAGDRFGQVLSAGDTNRDGYPDLAVGVPGERAGTAGSAGGAHILRGGKKGLTGTGSQWFTRQTAGVPGSAAAGAELGQDVRLRDLDRDGDADLLMSDRGRKSLLLPGGRGGITATSVRELPLRASFPQ
ncbi:FG-GAP and VCBS repeat-containing protein [Streptomyces sp. NPDC001985]|uniref:FG-GAP and VCBS repeat-containing protein n=1 Tax=Streptomyces sp. NPDC001985 TaxID=3154406 RepID=UPI00331C02AB